MGNEASTSKEIEKREKEREEKKRSREEEKDFFDSKGFDLEEAIARSKKTILLRECFKNKERISGIFEILDLFDKMTNNNSSSTQKKEDQKNFSEFLEELLKSEMFVDKKTKKFDFRGFFASFSDEENDYKLSDEVFKERYDFFLGKKDFKNFSEFRENYFFYESFSKSYFFDFLLKLFGSLKKKQGNSDNVDLFNVFSKIFSDESFEEKLKESLEQTNQAVNNQDSRIKSVDNIFDVLLENFESRLSINEKKINFK